jgi:steroid delta-isomerase-like uncharacterized protein
MSNEELNKIANAYMQVWTVSEENRLDQFADKDLEVSYSHFNKTYKDIEECKSVLKMTHNFFPDLKIHIKNSLPNSDNNTVTVMWQYEGTHLHGNLFGAEASGKKVAVSGITILFIENGLVKVETGIVDNLSLLMQLGVLR